MLMLKGQIVHTLSFGDHVVSVAGIHLWLPCSLKAAVENRQGNGSGCVSIKFHLQKQPADQICQSLI